MNEEVEEANELNELDEEEIEEEGEEGEEEDEVEEVEEEEVDEGEEREEDFEEEYYSQSNLSNNNSNSLVFKFPKNSQNGAESQNQYSEDQESNLGKKLTKRQKNIMMKNQVINEDLNDFEEPLMSLPEKKRKARKNKKILTEEEQIKKLQLEEKRKQQFKKMNEQKRQQVIDQILNESGRQKIKRNKEELQKDIEKQTHKFRQLPENDIKIKFISNPQGESLIVDQKLTGVNILKTININDDEKIHYNIIAQAAEQNNNGFTKNYNYCMYTTNGVKHMNGTHTNTHIYNTDSLKKQIEEQKKQLCSYCKNQYFKYKIPKTQLVACSLECFKQLKI